MNDLVSVEPLAVAATVPLTAGAMLRSAREVSGLHIAALAVAMKVPVKKLEALEADRLDLLHDAVFVRALAASVCRTLKIDSKPVLEKLPQSVSSRLNVDERGINAPFSTPGYSNRSFTPAVLMKPAVLLVFLLLAGAVGVAFMPDFKSTNQSVVEDPVQSLKPSVSVVTDVVAIPVQSLATPALSPQTISGTEAEKSKDAVVVLQPPKAEQTTTPPIVKPSVESILVLKARGPSWVNVTDSKGVVQLQKTLSTSEQVVVSGVAPFAVVIGRVDVVDVEVRGKPFSLAGIVIDNVARFEVK